MKKKQIKRIIVSSVACVAGLGIILGQGTMISNREMVIDKQVSIIEEKETENEIQAGQINKSKKETEELYQQVQTLNQLLDDKKAELDSATQRRGELKDEYSRLKEEVRTREVKAEQIAKTRTVSQPTKPVNKPSVASSNGRRITVEVSGYCTCYECSEGWGSQTADGHGVSWGVIAAPREIPFGTKMKIDGFDTTFTVHDRGGYIKKVGNVYRIDVWFPTHQQAERYGRRTVSATILE